MPITAFKKKLYQLRPIPETEASVSTRVSRKRMLGKRAGDWLLRIVGEERYQRLREWNRARKAARKARRNT